MKRLDVLDMLILLLIAVIAVVLIFHPWLGDDIEQRRPASPTVNIIDTP